MDNSSIEVDVLLARAARFFKNFAVMNMIFRPTDGYNFFHQANATAAAFRFRSALV
jgi:hypothetical protein